MVNQEACERCGHVRSAHESFAAGGCGSRVRVAGRVKICGCSEFRGANESPFRQSTVTTDEDLKTTSGLGATQALAGLS